MQTDEKKVAAWSGLVTPERRVSTFLLSITTMIFAFSEFFVSAAMPAAADEFASPWLLPWSFILFLVASVTTGAAASAIRGRFGLRWPLVLANLVLMAGSLLGYLADDPQILLAGRALQGVAEGAAIGLAYMLIPQVYTGGLIARVFGLESLVWAAAAFIAPALAGALTQYVSWRAPFALTIPVAALALLLSLYVPEGEKRGEGGAGAPWLQLMFLAGAVLLMSAASLVEIGPAFIFLLASAGIIGLFFWIDQRGQTRILPHSAFSSNSIIGNGVWLTFLMPVTAAAGSVYFIYALIEIAGLETLAASLVRSLLAICWSLVAFWVSNRDAQARERCAAFGGPLIAAGYGLMLVAFASGSVVLAGLGQVFVGFAFGLTWGPLSQILLEKASDNDRDRMAALLPLLQSIGFAIGGAFFGFVANASGIREGALPDAVQAGIVTIFAFALAVACLAVFFNLRLTKRLRREPAVKAPAVASPAES
nr:MFS transporter [Rhizobium sp. L1K21]